MAQTRKKGRCIGIELIPFDTPEEAQEALDLLSRQALKVFGDHWMQLAKEQEEKLLNESYEMAEEYED